MPTASVAWGHPSHLVARAREHEIILERDPGAAPAGLSAGELLLMALGACIAGTLRNHTSVANMPIRALQVEVRGERLDGPSRYGDFNVEVSVDGDLTARQVATLQRVAAACRVHNTLHQGGRTSVRVTSGKAPDAGS